MSLSLSIMGSIMGRVFIRELLRKCELCYTPKLANTSLCAFCTLSIRVLFIFFFFYSLRANTVSVNFYIFIAIQVVSQQVQETRSIALRYLVALWEKECARKINDHFLIQYRYIFYYYFFFFLRHRITRVRDKKKHTHAYVKTSVQRYWRANLKMKKKKEE